MFGLVLKYIKPYRLMFVLGSVSKFAEAMLELCLPLLMAHIIDVGIPQGNQDYILRMGGYLFLLAFLGVALALYCQYCAAVTSQGTGTLIRNAIVEKISAFSYTELDKLGTATLINRVTSDVNYVQQAVAFTMRLVSRAPFLCAGAVLMSFSIDVKLTLIFIVIIPVLGLLLFWFMRMTSPLYTKVQKNLDRAALVVRENLSGVLVIRAFSNTRKEEKRFDDTVQDLNDSNVSVANLAALMNPATSIIVNLGIIAILYFGASRVYGGYLTQGNILALSVYATKILYALIIVANLVVMFTKAAASSERINEVLSTEPSVIFPEYTNETGIAESETSIEFKHVRFSFNETENVLSDISFRVKKGDTLGIIGITGSGKTTLVNLLQRFYDTADGEIRLDGINIKDYSKIGLRQKIGIVPQHNVLFSGSIAENIRWGKENATDEEIVSALKTAQALDFVQALPDGTAAAIQEGGRNFSGGQRQRLAIARAIIKQPSILIMDDSLSALDYKTDLSLRKSLKEEFADTTIVIVSQRISSVINADTIIVLDEGVICGIGRHEDLFAACKTYKEIYESQFQDDHGDRMGGA